MLFSENVLLPYVSHSIRLSQCMYLGHVPEPLLPWGASPLASFPSTTVVKVTVAEGGASACIPWVCWVENSALLS